MNPVKVAGVCPLGGGLRLAVLLRAASVALENMPTEDSIVVDDALLKAFKSLQQGSDVRGIAMEGRGLGIAVPFFVQGAMAFSVNVYYI